MSARGRRIFSPLTPEVADIALSTTGAGYLLFRIGDCVAQRNTHAAIYDALRLCKDF